MHISEHKHFLIACKKGRFTLNKYGFNAPIIANTSIVASANPINNTWKDPENIEQSEFPTLTQIIHRFDFIFIFIENRTWIILEIIQDKEKKLLKNRIRSF